MFSLYYDIDIYDVLYFFLVLHLLSLLSYHSLLRMMSEELELRVDEIGG